MLFSKFQYWRKLSAKPIRYKLTLNDNPTNKAIPKVPPIGNPKLLEIIKYVPPFCTGLSVESEATLRPVVKDIMWAITMIPMVFIKPACPMIAGKRRYMITPKMVNMEGVNTPLKVPNFLALAIIYLI